MKMGRRKIRKRKTRKRKRRMRKTWTTFALSPAIDWFDNTEPYYQTMLIKKVTSSQLSSTLHSNKQTN